MAALHASHPGSSFWLPATIEEDTHVGLWVDGELVAAAGTHLLSESRSVSAIGGVITRPDRRGRGYAGVVSAGVVERIGTRVSTIGLNVREGNSAAIRAYTRIGFEVCWRYEEVELR